MFLPIPRKNNSRSAIVFFLLAFFLIPSSRLMAQGDLLIYPKRVVFDGTKRSQDINLVNNGNDTARYEISVVQIRMKEDGSFENITEPDPGQNFAHQNFRFFPRSVVLGPKEAQTVKIQVTKYAELESGEYRSHLYFRAEPDRQPLDSGKTSSVASSIAISITPIYGISIPVIIRVGESTTEISLSKMALHFEQDSLPILQLLINRSGNMSVYGDITVDHISQEGKEQRVAQVKGVAVYTPNANRMIRLALLRSKEIDYHSGVLHIVFTDSSGKAQKLAQDQLYLR